MTGPNHIVGGVVFTGIFGAIIGFNVLSSPWYIAMTILSSLMPDIDHTKSIIGKAVWPLAKLIDRKYGHRTITHSFMALIISTLVVQVAQSYFVQNSTFTTIWFLGYLSHLIFDMVTIQGVPLFYPFMLNACVLPANPSKRMRTNDLRAEAKVFGFFIFMTIAFKPLIEQGFWTSYNRLFGTMKHLVSEYHKSEDLLSVNYTYRIASDVYTGSGLLVECTESKAALIDGDRWKILDKSTMIVDEVIPDHTGILYGFERVNFVGVSADSLNEILRDRKLIDYEFEANDVFKVYTAGIEKQTKREKGSYTTDLSVAVDEQQHDIQKGEVIKYKKNPRRATIERQISKIQRSYNDKLNQYTTAQSKVIELQGRYDSSEDLYDKESLLAQIRELNKVQQPAPITFDIQQLESELKELTAEDYRILAEKEEAQRIQEIEGQKPPIRFSGYIQYFEIRDRS